MKAMAAILMVASLFFGCAIFEQSRSVQREPFVFLSAQVDCQELEKFTDSAALSWRDTAALKVLTKKVGADSASLSESHLYVSWVYFNAAQGQLCRQEDWYQRCSEGVFSLRVINTWLLNQASGQRLKLISN